MELRVILKTACFLAVILTFLDATGSGGGAPEQTRRPFKVPDDIGLALFRGSDRPVRFSPDGKHFAVYYERGQLDLNRVEGSLRFYRTQDIRLFLRSPAEGHPPSPIWVVSRSSKEGHVIGEWRWLADSSGVAFSERTDRSIQRLMLANLRTKILEPLTPETATVKGFDVRDRSHYVFAVADPSELKNRRAERQRPAIVGTGRELQELLFPDDELVIRAWLQRRSRLWAVVGSKPFEVGHGGAQFADVGAGNATLALSPDGRQIVTALRVPDVPPSWKTLYSPSSPTAQSWVSSGGPVNQYVVIDLTTGSVRSLTEAPTGSWWWQDENPSWSPDGRTVLLPDTFVKSKDNLPTRPCTALVNLLTNSVTCVGDVKRTMSGPIDETDGLAVTVKQGLNQPPLLIATEKRASRVIWDPNPQLNSIELGQAEVYEWKDNEAREWSGGLYKPVGYTPGRGYPLVIQTHGFTESEFIPAGFEAAAGYAARELAAAGVMVLQVAEEPSHCGVGWTSPTSGSCAVTGYVSAVDQLVSDGLVERSRIGIMGFSATCFSVMELLTTSSLHVSAAVLNDGSTHGYLLYLTTSPAGAAELDIIMGARPFGDGLQQWLKHAPDFKLDKVSAPLLVVAAGPTRLLQWLWEPYAGLRYLHKPVELIILNTDEHVLANPAVRMASQGGTVDWFRFWLKGEEDPDPAKAEQYARWRELRKLQHENEKKPGN